MTMMIEAANNMIVKNIKSVRALESITSRTGMDLTIEITGLWKLINEQQDIENFGPTMYFKGARNVDTFGNIKIAAALGKHRVRQAQFGILPRFEDRCDAIITAAFRNKQVMK